MDARVPEDNVDICRLAQNSRSVTHHAQAMTCTSVTLEARPVREQSDGGQWACQVSGHAGDLQPSGGRGRLRHREEARRRFDSVRKRVKLPQGVIITYVPEGTVFYPLVTRSKRRKSCRRCPSLELRFRSRGLSANSSTRRWISSASLLLHMG